MKFFNRLILTLTVLGCSLLAKANGEENNCKKVPGPEGSLQGYVMDATTKKPINGVTVSVTSGKMQGEKEIVSNASGYFKFPQLPAGEVTLQIEKKGYKPLKREGLIVKEGILLKLNFEVEEMEEDESTWRPLFRMMDSK